MPQGNPSTWQRSPKIKPIKKRSLPNQSLKNEIASNTDIPAKTTL
ncbi:hypothetical protein [Pseudanabaena sp. BC1403]|nr:hypothetical protein [Pseudanabaena sp. BC1403]